MKYEKPPVSLDHLQHSAVYRAVHEGAGAGRRVDLLTPVVAEADYRELKKENARKSNKKRLMAPPYLSIPRLLQQMFAIHHKCFGKRF
ncbi:Uncharacterized protein OBRU01_16935 [Operophtera brumata]|uniref:Uncharacterized protein n=1 Tax=Operophtera brumata TaxID=104452 RepID=A0A0L7L203_OPEBR|nr:Uncharacterized protein OBRU01_16935 [Operophtera brumata]